MVERGIRPGLPVVVALCALVVAFRVAAWVWPSTLVEIRPEWRLPLGLLGFLFLACGTAVWLLRPDRLTRVFLIYGLGGAVHWGGAVGSDHEFLSLVLTSIYAAATSVFDGAFLDLAIRYPDETKPPQSLVFLIYAPAVLAPLAPGLVLGLAFLLSILGTAVFLTKWGRAVAAGGASRALHAIAASLVIVIVLSVLADGGVLPGGTDAWAMSFAIVPLALARALVTRGGSR